MKVVLLFFKCSAVFALFFLAGCGGSPLLPLEAPRQLTRTVAPQPDRASVVPAAEAAGENLIRGKSRWVPVPWSELPGVEQDALFEVWNAWLKSCERPGPVFAPLCPEVRRLSIGDEADRLAWLQSRLQPYRVEPLQGGPVPGLLTAYFEPEFDARRVPGDGFSHPLFRLPVGMSPGKPWYSRREVDTLPEAQAALRGQAIVYLEDSVDALLLQIQGSGRIRVTEADGRRQWVRLAYAGHNGQPYKSIGRWLLDEGELRDASWSGIRGWISQNPQRVSELLWQNPRLVFFKEEPLSEFDAAFGPRGAQGVPLTPGRSIAVDPASIPYGTPVWLASEGPNLSLQRLVMAQDTGSAIVGPTRADYFVGWGADAGELAGRLKQPLRLWALWPKQLQ